MKIIRNFNKVPTDLIGGALAVGNFDGIHRGHQELIKCCRHKADSIGGPALALTFEPHPRSIFQIDAPPFRLTPFRSKARLLAALGIDCLVSLQFSKKTSLLAPNEFIHQILAEGLGVRHVIVGYDFVFGHRRSGNVEFLKKRGKHYGFGVSVLEPVTHDDDVCSSTIIRVDLETGRCRRAAELLGHWWEIEGRVRNGDRRGRQIGFPTANLHLHDSALRPALGVYAIRFGIEKNGVTHWHDGVANLGKRPTFDGNGIILEAHLFDFNRDIYGRHGRVAFIEHLRPERKFDGLEAIRKQIALDCEHARNVLANPDYSHSRFSTKD